MDHVSWPRVGRELIRALRAKRSQTVFSRSLGYRSNVAYPWESGRREPSASEFFRAVSVFWGDPNSMWSSFPLDLAGVDLTSSQGVGELLKALRGTARLQTIADELGCSRFTVSRWLKGQTEPKLGAFLELVEVLTLRGADLVFTLCDPNQLPSLEAHWHTLQARRRVSFTHPWSSAILRQLELERYRSLPRHKPGFIAEQLGIERAVEDEVLCALRDAGLIREQDGKYVTDPDAVDTSMASDDDRNFLRRHWLGEAAARIGKNANDRFSWSVFAVSRSDFRAIREMQVEYMQALRQRIDASHPSEIVGLASVQLVELSRSEIPSAS